MNKLNQDRQGRNRKKYDRSKFTTAKKTKWFNAQGGLCHYCRCPMEFHIRRLGPDDDRVEPYCATWDHVVPLIRGGTSADRNLVLACHQCNQEKGDKRIFIPGANAERIKKYFGVELCRNRRFK